MERGTIYGCRVVVRFYHKISIRVKRVKVLRETCQGSDRSSDRGGITPIELETNWELSVNPDLVIQLGKIAVTL